MVDVPPQPTPERKSVSLKRDCLPYLLCAMLLAAAMSMMQLGLSPALTRQFDTDTTTISQQVAWLLGLSAIAALIAQFVVLRPQRLTPVALLLSAGVLMSSGLAIMLTEQLWLFYLGCAVLSFGAALATPAYQLLLNDKLADGAGAGWLVAADRRSQMNLKQDERLSGELITGRRQLLEGMAFPPGSTVIVDQGEKLSLKETLTLLDGAARHNVQVLITDSGQRTGTGSALMAMKDAGVNTYRWQGGEQRPATIISEPDRNVRYARLAGDFAASVHPGGFEPPTARFVAEYSIQLSYGCIGKIYFTADIDIATKAISSKRWCIREDYSPCGSPFGPLLKQRYHPWCLRLIPLPLRYLHC